MKCKTLGQPPAELMIVEDDNDTDPYNSGLFRKLRDTDVAFVRDGRALLGDTTTVNDDE